MTSAGSNLVAIWLKGVMDGFGNEIHLGLTLLPLDNGIDLA